MLDPRFSPEMEKAVQRCMADVMADKPSSGRWALYKWRRRWRKTEYELFITNNSVNWVVCKEALNRIGGFWWLIK